VLPVFCGDLVNRPRHDASAWRTLTSRWQATNPDLVVVPGNHDPEEEDGPWEGVRVHERRGLRILAVPYIPIMYKIPTWTHEISEARIEERLTPFADQRFDLVASHGPPHGHLDVVASGRHVGSHALLAFAGTIAFDAWICGHVHEQGGRTSDVRGRPLYNVARTVKRISLASS
jgi:Icc-related predicted phosphoesterase